MIKHALHFCLCDTQTLLTLACILMCDHPQAAIDSATEWQQAAVIPTSYNTLFVCVFMWSVRPEKPSVSECLPRPEQTRQDRTEQAIFSHSLWLNSLFSHQSLWNCSVSLHERHPDGTVGSKASKQIVRGWVARLQWAGMSEHLKNEAKEKQLIKSATLCLGLFSLVLTRWQTSPVHRGLGWHVYVQLPCYTQVKQDGSNVVDWLAPDGVSDLPSTLIWHDWLQAAM